MVTIQVARMKKKHNFELMSGQRRGNTTAPNRSTAIRTRLWTDTKTETYCTKGSSLHKAWPRGPLISQESTYNSVSFSGSRKIGYSRSDIAMFTIKKLIGFLMVFVLQTIIPMKMFPASETINVRQ